MRGIKLEVNTNLKMVVEECCACGCVFAMTEYMKKEFVGSKKFFHCPNGHSQHYTGKTEEEGLREQLERAERQRDSAQAREKMTENSLRAVKGHVTRLKNKAKNGVCPCCNRSFVNMRRHMDSKHPEYGHE